MTPEQLATAMWTERCGCEQPWPPLASCEKCLVVALRSYARGVLSLAADLADRIRKLPLGRSEEPGT